MERRVAVAIIISFFLLAVPIYADEGREVDILHYDLQIQVFPDEHKLDVAAVVKIKALGDSVKSVDFSFNEDLQIGTVRAGDRVLDYERRENDAMVFLDPPLNENEEVELTFEYSGIADLEPGLGESVWGYIGEEGSFMIYEATWYPMVWGDRSTAVVRIKVPDGQTGVSTGGLIEVVDGNKYDEFVWKTDVPTRGLSFAVGNYVVATATFGHIPIFIYTYPSDIYSSKDRIKKSTDILDFYSSLFGEYPYPGLTIVEIPDYFMGGHADQGMIMLYSRAFKKELSTEFLAHEIAHNWWGALVSAEGEYSLRSSEGFGVFSRGEKSVPLEKREHNLWLLEGFASYSSILYTEHSGGREKMADSLDEVRTEYLSKIRTYQDEPIINAEEEYGRGLYHAIVYSKGALVMHMLRYVVGDDTFFEIMDVYAQRYGGKSTTVREFQSLCEEVSGSSLDWFFEEWIRGTTLPDYAVRDVKVTESASGYVVSFELLQAGDIAKMPVDVTLHTAGADITKKVWVDESFEQVSITTDSKPVYIEVDQDGWILESDRSNNLHVIDCPLNLLGVKLFLAKIGALI